ncbi:SDR family oxidoreductase [Roseateles sp. UC29_93]|uniref:SDR family oxidoreductase n=1 Tax=Roseateles sp. UC29_93 TaxID=3350177 RepID=UPI00366D796F
MIVVTGATGQLGRLVIDRLLSLGVASAGIVAAVRTPSKAADLAARGVVVREADYTRPDTLTAAFVGAERVLLISSNEIGERIPQHRAVIDAAKAARVSQLVYTSVLHADRSPLGLAGEHRETEALIKAAGLTHVLLRNGWYVENYLAALPMALKHGAFLGSAGEGSISWATRADYADAAAAVLTRPVDGHVVFELAGDRGHTLTELAAEVARQSGQPVQYKDLPRADYERVLLDAGLPAPLAELLADSDEQAAKGALQDDGGALARLIGRPTTTLDVAVGAALA